ncbi:MAG: ATP-binding cassette domain-containing protein [Planctomycetaceae bacterium]|nr:ATP-binding cassette domain-containing protein [Planctomycetaceae bacterium]
MAETLWELSHVTLGRGSAPRLNDVSLTLCDGVTAVIGPSGAGKTSLLNLLVGFERPDAGAMTQRISASDERLPLAWVPPDFGLWPHLTVRQHLETVRPEQIYSPEIDELLSAFNLDRLATVSVGRLSQGERSRLAVARALACDPLVLVMDEPLVHVDPASLDHYWRTISEHCVSRETALVFSTHAPDVVLREASRVVCLDAGRVSFDGTVDSLYASPPSREVARLLGPSNWFDAKETANWLPDREVSNQPVCIRPSQLELAPSSNGSGLRVHRSRRVGTLIETEVEHEPTHDRRTLVHRPGDGPLTEGTRVLLRLCLLLLACLVWSGCQSSEAGPQLPVTNSRTLKMPADGSSVPAPRSLTVSEEGELYVLDNAGRVLVYDNTGELTREWRMPEYDVGRPEGVCILDDGTVAVADTHYHRIVVFSNTGDVLRMFGEHGEEAGQFIYPVAITKDDSGHLYVAEYGGNDRIQKFTTSGEFITTFGSFGTDEGQFQRPSGVVWLGGLVYIADAINNRVHVYSDDGEYRETIVDAARENSVSVNYPYDIALGPDASLFLVEYGAGRVTQIDTEGNLLGRHGSVGRGKGQFYTPWGITVDRQGRVFVADTGNHRTVELSL